MHDSISIYIQHVPVACKILFRFELCQSNLTWSGHNRDEFEISAGYVTFLNIFIYNA